MRGEGKSWAVVVGHEVEHGHGEAADEEGGDLAEKEADG